MGYDALQANTTGYANTALGANTLEFNTSGVNNTANGANALYANKTGGESTGIGTAALTSNTSESDNTATGVSALWSNTTGQANTAVGTYALDDNTTGFFNMADGYGAITTNTTGSYNTASGFDSLFNNTTGNNNIAIGYSAAYSVARGNSNNIHIGSEGASADSGAIRIGTSGTQTSFFVAGVRGVATGDNNAVSVVVDSNGQLGTVSSSRRFKTDIQDMGDASRDLMRLRPVTFRYQKPFADGSQPIQYGLIAEEVAEVFPDLVAHSADGQIETVKYQLLDPMLLNEVQRQQAEIRELQAWLNKIESALAH